MVGFGGTHLDLVRTPGFEKVWKEIDHANDVRPCNLFLVTVSPFEMLWRITP